MVGIDAEACTCITKRIEDDSVHVFALQFAERIFFFMLGLEGKTNEPLSGVFALAERIGYIRREGEVKQHVRLSFGFLDFVCCLLSRCKIRDGGSEDMALFWAQDGYAFHLEAGGCGFDFDDMAALYRSVK